MQTTAQELATLNLYCTSALQNARLLGQMVRRAHDPQLRLELAKRSADALLQAELWAETIRALGGKLQATGESYQALYKPYAGQADTLVQVLAMVQVLEQRLARQFLRHFRRPGTHPVVRASLRRVIEEELRPGWTTKWLEHLALAHPDRVQEAVRRYAAADRAIAEPGLDAPSLPKAA